MKQKLVAFILTIIMFLISITLPINAASTSALEDEKNNIKDQIEEAEKEQKEIESKLSEELKEITNLEESIEEMENEITKLESEIESLQKSIKEKQNQLEEKQKEYDRHKTLLEERLSAMYEQGETTFLDILFNSSNIIEFISNYYMMQEISECDNELLDTIETEKIQIEDTKKQLEDEKEKVDNNKKQVEAKNNKLKVAKKDKQEKADSLSEQDKELKSKIDSYNKQVAQIDAQIEEILRKAQEQINQATGGSGLKFDGSFIWPCNNKIITSTVKPRWGKWHKGIDIGARNENVYASASGYAYTMENPGGYGHYIMIVHGDGYITLYGHLNSYKISYGQYVTQGQVIAQSGNSGASTGPHLHFEIRKASSLSSYFSSAFLNPLDYLPGGYTFTSTAQIAS